MWTVEEILLHEAGVPADLLAKAQERLKDHQDLGDALIELGALSAAGWARTQAAYYGLPYSETVPLGEHTSGLLERVPLTFTKQHQILPITPRDGAIVVALVDPREIPALDDLRLVLGAPIEPLVVPKPTLQEALTRAAIRRRTDARALITLTKNP
jgi:hypothetical protein